MCLISSGKLYPKQLLMRSSKGEYFWGKAVWSGRWGKKYIRWSLGEINRSLSLSWLIFPIKDVLLLCLLFMESLILVLKIKPVLVLKGSDLQSSAHPTLVFICSAEREYWKEIYFYFQTCVQMMSPKLCYSMRFQNILCFVWVQRVTLRLQAITILEMHWLFPLFPWRWIQQYH